MIRQRNYLPHAIERERIFLLPEEEAQQRNQRLGQAPQPNLADCDRGPARGARRGDAEPGELPAQQTRWTQYLDRALAFGALDDTIQQRRIGRAGAGIVVFQLTPRQAPPGGRPDRRQSRPGRRRA